jgi:peptide deformylase
LGAFIDQMLAAMLAAGGVGIAAPQVFCSKQIMVIASKPNDRYPDAPDMEPLVMINPQIKLLLGDIVRDWEGCLSVPGIRGWIPRHDAVDVDFQSRDGGHQSISLRGFTARIFQHEHDHLVGLTFVDRVTDIQHLVSIALAPRYISGELQLVE